MVEVVLFHHVQGLTEGVRQLAEGLRAAGHTVHLPDLYDGSTAVSVEEGFELRSRIGVDVVDERAAAALAELPTELVYAGVSLGVAYAQRLAQTRRGALGALLYEAFFPATGDDPAFGPWPQGVPVQVHGMERDPFFGLEGDLDAARELEAALGPEQARVFVYPGERHLFTDSTLPGYDAEATRLVVERSLELLDRVGTHSG